MDLALTHSIADATPKMTRNGIEGDLFEDLILGRNRIRRNIISTIPTARKPPLLIYRHAPQP